MLRIGILSDVHISQSVWGLRQHERLKKAFLFFKQKGVDGVLISGDLQENLDMATAQKNIREFTDIWFSIFPDNINDLTGERVEPLFIYGNHDRTLSEAGYWPSELGSFQEGWLKEVKGYWFVGAHYTKEGTQTVTELLHQAQKLSGDQPFFYTQHLPVKDTLFGTDAGLLGAGGSVYSVLQNVENCVVFTGHTHIPITDERSIWQPEDDDKPRFTAVNCATTNYAYIKSSNLDVNGCGDDTQQGLYMLVEGSVVTLERYSFYPMQLHMDRDGDIHADAEQAALQGKPWVFNACQTRQKPYAYKTRCAQARKPEFAPDAVLEVGSVGPTVVNLLIPPATVSSPEGYSDLVQSYFVEAVDVQTGNIATTSQVASVYHVDAADTELKRNVFLGMDGLEPGHTYLLKAYARECYQKCSQPLTAEITTPQKL